MIEPCPFCGVDLVRLHYKEADGWPEWVECANCHATGDKRALKQDAIDSWNRLSRIVRAAEAWAWERKAYGTAPMNYNDLYGAEGDLYDAIKVEGGRADGR